MGPRGCDRFVAHCFSCDVLDALHHRAKLSQDRRRSRSTPSLLGQFRCWRYRFRVAPAFAVLLEFRSAIAPDPVPPTFGATVPCSPLKHPSAPRGVHMGLLVGGTS